MTDSNRHTSTEPGDDLRSQGASDSGARQKPHSLAPTAGDVEAQEAARPKSRPDLLPWVMAISAVVTVAAVVFVYESRKPMLFTSELASATDVSNDDDVFEHAEYGALRWRSSSPVSPSDFASHADQEEAATEGLGPDLVALASSLGDAERRAAECKGVENVEDVKLSVTFHPAGYVARVEVEDAPELDVKAVECIEQAVMSTATPLYVGEEMTIQHMFRMR